MSAKCFYVQRVYTRFTTIITKSKFPSTKCAKILPIDPTAEAKLVSLRVLIFCTWNSKDWETDKAVYCKHNIILLLWVDLGPWEALTGGWGKSQNDRMNHSPKILVAVMLDLNYVSIDAGYSAAQHCIYRDCWMQFISFYSPSKLLLKYINVVSHHFSSLW